MKWSHSGLDDTHTHTHNVATVYIFCGRSHRTWFSENVLKVVRCIFFTNQLHPWIIVRISVVDAVNCRINKNQGPDLPTACSSANNFFGVKYYCRYLLGVKNAGCPHNRKQFKTGMSKSKKHAVSDWPLKPVVCFPIYMYARDSIRDAHFAKYVQVAQYFLQ